MKFSPIQLVILLCSFVYTSSAYIISVTTNGSKAKIGKNHTFTFSTRDYIQNWNDYSAILGFTDHPIPDPISVGGVITGSLDLVALGESNTGFGNFSTKVFIDPNLFVNGTYVMNAAITSVVGASLETFVRFLNTTFVVTH